MRLAGQLVRDQRLIRPRPIYPTAADQRRTFADTTIPGVTMTAGGSANTDGSWAVLVASTAIEATMIHMRFMSITRASTADTNMLMDIAIGDGAGNPVTTLVEDLQVGQRDMQDTLDQPGINIPLRVPQGVELLGRIRCATASDTAEFSVHLYGDEGGSSAPVFRHCTTYGAVPASSSGTTLTAPGAVNTKSAWTEITSAITNPIYALMIGPAFDGNSFNNTFNFIDVGAGAAGSERVIVPDIRLRTTSVEATLADAPGGQLMFLTEPLGIGERIAARYQTTFIGSPPNLIVYGFS